MRYLLDTNTLIYALNARPRHQAVLERFDREAPEDLAVSSITLAELRYGIAKSRRREANRRALRQVLEALNVVPFDAHAANRYGSVRAELEAAGRPIGPLDTLIAAHALSLSLTLVTSNTREFSRVRRLRVENWIPG
ncbi:MAG: type II toxin-antitoxin system tRNA(fMet)-specific endonuclease VapC [Burkholderiales bacterium]